jgi:cyclopropane fatty-acyl-phospholipid synthase-like methyltransferase
MPLNAKAHYNEITDAWRDFMGEHFHFGYFETEDTDQDTAVAALTDKMLAMAKFKKDTKVLDVGCGIGGPAFYIYDKYKCFIDGISTSDRGIELANTSSEEKGCDDRVKFYVADGQKNGMKDKSYDVVWVMESSHMMPNKKALFSECNRVLKDDGALILCDLMMLVNFRKQLAHFIKNPKAYRDNMKTFGFAQLIPMGMYAKLLVEAGFTNLQFIDISKEATPTGKIWAENAKKFRGAQGKDFTNEDVDLFVRACEAMYGWFKEGIIGYGVVKATK